MSTRKYGAPVLSIRTASSSTASSPTSSSAEYEADDEENMTMSDYHPSRPLTVSIPKHYATSQCSQRRPNLAEILANNAPPPWTLSAFMAYMSQNHCLETLEFTMDASRYRKHYNKMVNRTPGSPISPLSDECTYIKMLWKRLLDAYIAPNGPREVNLPSDVRDSLLSLSDPYLPPHPSTLEPAVSKIYELMEESVLVPFLNSVCPQSATVDSGFDHHDEILQRSHTRSYDERPSYTRNHPPHHPAHQRASAPSSLTSNFMHPRPFSHSRFASQPTTTSTCSSAPSSRTMIGYASGSDALTDDSGSASPSGLDDPMTPPNTPPMSDYSHYTAYYENGHSGTPSPRNSRVEHGLAGATKDGWKRVSSKLWPRKRSGGALREEEQGAVEGGLF